ncbi:hypothetical protein Tco_0465599 [Tanacetum coccineum]
MFCALKSHPNVTISLPSNFGGVTFHGGSNTISNQLPDVDLIGDEDPTYEDGDIGVLVSLGDEIFLEGKKSQESSIGDSDNTGDGGKTAGRAIITWGGGIKILVWN